MMGDCIMNSNCGLAASRDFTIAGTLAITTGLVVTRSLTSLAIVNDLAIGSDSRAPGSDHDSNRGGRSGRNCSRGLVCGALNVGRDCDRAHIRCGSDCESLRLCFTLGSGSNCDFFGGRSHRNGLLFRCRLGLE